MRRFRKRSHCLASPVLEVAGAIFSAALVLVLLVVFALLVVDHLVVLANSNTPSPRNLPSLPNSMEPSCPTKPATFMRTKLAHSRSQDTSSNEQMLSFCSTELLKLAERINQQLWAKMKTNCSMSLRSKLLLLKIDFIEEGLF